jgi:hypothetical protein
MIPEDTRIQGFRGSSEIPKRCKDLKVWQASYELCLEVYRTTAKFPVVHLKNRAKIERMVKALKNL